MVTSTILTKDIAKEYVEAHLKDIRVDLTVTDWISVSEVAEDTTDPMRRHRCDITVERSDGEKRNYAVYDDGLVDVQDSPGLSL